MKKRWQRVCAIVLTVVMLTSPVLTPAAIAQESMNDYVQGKLDGERDAKGNPVWFLAGCLAGATGVIGAYVVKPDPPAYQLLGKSPEYIMGYTEGYQNKARDRNVMYALVGCGTFVIGYCYLLVLASPSPE